MRLTCLTVLSSGYCQISLGQLEQPENMNTPACLSVQSHEAGMLARRPAGLSLDVVKSKVGPWPSKDISEIKTTEDELTLLIFHPQIFN